MSVCGDVESYGVNFDDVDFDGVGFDDVDFCGLWCVDGSCLPVHDWQDHRLLVAGKSYLALPAC